MTSALNFGILSHGGKNEYWGGVIFLFVMHQGDADYGYPPSIVGIFFYRLSFGELGTSERTGW